jgi:hypothetical protein
MTAGNQRQAGVGAPSFTPAMGGGMSPTAPTMNNAMTLSLMGQQPPQQGNALAMQAAPMTQLQAAPIAAPQPAPALSAFQQAQQDAAQRKLALDVQKASAETKAREEAKLAVANPEAERLKNVGKQEFQGSLAAMVDQYKDLGRQGVLIEKGTSLGQRALTFAGAQAPGIAGVVSPEVGGPMQTLTNMRSTLLTGLMAATGMSSKQIDSNKEMQNYLDAMTSPGQTVKTITDTFNELSRKYGTGQTIKPEDISPPKSSSGIPSGRRSAAPVKPTERPPLSSFGG